MLSLPEGRAWPAARRLARRSPRAILRALAFLSVTLGLLPLFVLAGGLGRRPQHWLRKLWCRCCLRLLGLEVRYRGKPIGVCATLFVANHVSYLDILLLGARTDATFIAKAEVAGWPLFGTIGRAAGTFFVRRRRLDALIQRNALAARLRAGESFVLFAEGTSSDGLGVLPLKTSLLSVAEPWVLDRPIAVQPVALAYRRLKGGEPFDAASCGRFAWFGEARLLPHLWAMLHEAGCVVEVVFGEPVMSWSVESRKALGPELRRALAREVAPSLPTPTRPARPAPAADLAA